MWYPGIYKNEVDSGIEFSKTSVIDKTQLPKLVFNADYTSYDLLLFVVNNTADNTTLEFLTTPEMIGEIFTYSVGGYGAAFSLVKNGTNNYVNYTYSSNTVFNKYNNRNLVVADVYSITCNKTINKTMLYRKQAITNVDVTVSTQDNIFDNDLLIISCCSNQWEQTTISNIITNLFNVKQFSDNYIACCAKYNNGIVSSIITEHGITAGPFFAIQGIKFT